MRKIFFPGSFNPFTKGHADIVERLLTMADTVTVGIGKNIDKPADAALSERNADAVRDWAQRAGIADRVEVVTYSGLTAEESRRLGADCMARGVRNGMDFEYEYSLAAMNRDAFGVETILLPADAALCMVSSTAIRDLQAHGRSDIAEKYLP